MCVVCKSATTHVKKTSQFTLRSIGLLFYYVCFFRIYQRFKLCADISVNRCRFYLHNDEQQCMCECVCERLCSWNSQRLQNVSTRRYIEKKSYNKNSNPCKLFDIRIRVIVTHTICIIRSLKSYLLPKLSQKIDAFLFKEPIHRLHSLDVHITFHA